ncbi:MAG: NAD(P)H-hydrate dehydratase [Pseudomonadota bacterium]|nr:NAD(P)H-hydrate dehydratase [Pseudomonadota bacterium]
MVSRLIPAKAAPLFDLAATRRIEVTAQAALSPHTLMRRAGLATARLALALAPHARTFWIACGPGNNGGDGLEAAMHLRQWGLNPVVTWLGDEDHLPADARASLQRAHAARVAFTNQLPVLGAQDLGIDALLGIGATRPPEGSMAELLAHLHASPATLLAVDVPSGLQADTGVWQAPDAPYSIADRAQWTGAEGQFGLHPCAARRHTLSLLTLKPGLFTAQGRDACGTLWFDDLGVTPDNEPPSAWLNAPPPAPPRPHASHKGSHGDVVVIGGEHDPTRHSAMTGAALLAASAALHGGAGRVYVSLLGDDTPALDVYQPELMFRRADALPLNTMTVVCGCGGGEAVRAALPAVLAQAPRLVLDADALNAIAQDPALQAALTQRATRQHVTVLTPHPLEAARLLSTDTRQVQADRLAAATALATRFQCVAVLKGSGSIIAAAGEVPRINPTGNARLATPGTGDVLAGLIGALLAAGQTPFSAACAAVCRHGAAANAWPAGSTLTAGLLARRLG